MTEGGQSSTGQVRFFFFLGFLRISYNHSQLIDFMITTHPAYQELVKLGQEQQKNIHTGVLSWYTFHSNDSNFASFIVLEEKLEKLRVENNVGSLTELIKDLHIYPDFHGNSVLFLFISWNLVYSWSTTTSGFQETDLQSLIQGCKDPLLVFHL